MDMLLKSLLFLGLVLFLGAGIFARWVGPELLAGASRAPFHRLRLGWWSGALLILSASTASLIDTVAGVFGGFDPALVGEFALSSRIGRVSLARGVIVLALLALGLGGRLPRTLDRVALVLLGGGLLLTLSQLSHAGAMGEALPLAADVFHLAAATLWTGPLLFLAWLPIWHERRETRADVLPAVKRVSRLGLVSVLLLTGTGVYASLLHLLGFEDLTTYYGRTLIVKVGLVAVILLIAAINRWWFMPKMERKEASQGLTRFVRLESLLLVAVLAATGLLTTLEPPPGHHDQGVHGFVGTNAPPAVRRPLNRATHRIPGNRAASTTGFLLGAPQCIPCKPKKIATEGDKP